MIISIVDSATGWDSRSSQIMTSILVVVVAGSTRSRGRFSRTAGACKLTNTVHCGWVISELKGVSLMGSL